MIIKTAMAYEKISPGTILYGKKSALCKMLPHICVCQGEKLLSNLDLHAQYSKTDGENY